MLRRATLLVLLLVLVACSSLSRAKGDYKAGRVPEAKDKLVALEAESRGWGDTRRCEYALYRGLVHHELGDRVAAAKWLHEAKAIEDAHPGTLGEDDQTRLKVALESLEPSTQ
jgi:hypothetical protein